MVGGKFELRLRNDPERDPDTGLPFSTRNFVACLTEGARRFGWESRPRVSRSTRDGDWWVGTGVAGSTYPVLRQPGSAAASVRYRDGRYEVGIGAADLGTGSSTVPCAPCTTSASTSRRSSGSPAVSSSRWSPRSSPDAATTRSSRSE